MKAGNWCFGLEAAAFIVSCLEEEACTVGAEEHVEGAVATDLRFETGDGETVVRAHGVECSAIVGSGEVDLGVLHTARGGFIEEVPHGTTEVHGGEYETESGADDAHCEHNHAEAVGCLQCAHHDQ